MLRIEQTYRIKASPEGVWAALTEPALQAKWSGQPAKYDARVGGAYTLFDDYVSGQVVECDPPKRLSQTWKPDDWTIADSVVTFTLTRVRGGTQLDLVHENVQPEDYDGTSKGWDDFYIGAIKSMLEAEKPKPKRKATKKPARAKKPAVEKRVASKRIAGAPQKKKPSLKKQSKR